MFLNSQVRILWRNVCVIGLCAFFNQAGLTNTTVSGKTMLAQALKTPVSFDELDESEPPKTEDEEAADGGGEAAKETGELQEKGKKSRVRKSPLPTVDELIEAKLSALRSKQEEQEKALAVAEQKLAQEVAIEKRTFDNNAYVSLSIKNTAPPQDYELKSADIYVDGKRIARGGPRNNGLPRNAEFFFGAVDPGCHDVRVVAKYIRLKNDLISRFKVDRVVHVTKTLGFVAKNGYRVEINIEGFEQHNSLVNWHRGPALRFNRSVRPNFLPGATMVSMDDVLKQGRLHIEYLTEDTTHHELVEKSLSIDGLPILVAEKHNPKNDKSIVFDGPLAEGKHTLNVVLLFKEKKWVQGGANYNFRLSFNRDFYVISGQNTFVNLAGMPNDGFKRSSHDTRYARAISEIKSQEYSDMFSDMTCKEQRDKAATEEQKKIRDAAKVKVQQKEAPAPEKSGEEVGPTPASTPAAGEPAAPPKPEDVAPAQPETPPLEEQGGEPGLLPVPTEVPLPSPPVIVPDQGVEGPGSQLLDDGVEHGAVDASAVNAPNVDASQKTEGLDAPAEG